MAKFLRDRQMKAVSISKNRIDELFALCHVQANRLVAGGVNADDIEVRCMIRFDEKGYNVYNLHEVHNYYDQASEVERLILTIETRESLVSGRKFGPFLELTLDKNLGNYLVASSDDREWVEAAFAAFDEVMTKSAAWYRPIRTIWTELVIQVTGVASVFLLSVIAAKQLAPKLVVENAFLIAFLFAFLLAANIWTFIQRQVHTALLAMFPNARFVRSGREHLHWVPQAVISALIGGAVAYVLSELGTLLLGASKTLFAG